MNLKRVTRKEGREPKEFALTILKYLQADLNDKYKFTFRLVGSAVWNTILKDKDGFFDLDYQILLTANSKEYKNNKLNDSTNIKGDFFNSINNKFKNDKLFKVENSTTAITIINKDKKFSIDFVIIKLYPENNLILRRNNQGSKNEFTWNELKDAEDIYKKWNKLSARQKQELIEKYILPLKEREKSKCINDPTKKSSYEIFLCEVNNYVQGLLKK